MRSSIEVDSVRAMPQKKGNLFSGHFTELSYTQLHGSIHLCLPASHLLSLLLLATCALRDRGFICTPRD